MYPAKSVKYLGIKTDENLTWNGHINDIAIKLNRGIIKRVKTGQI